MFAINRKEELCRELLKNKSIIVKEMAEKLNVTEETIRRDIKALENEGIAERTHGGAVLKSTVMNVFSNNERKQLFVENKKAMANITAQYVVNNMCIFMDSSTTVYETLPLIWDKNLTIVSNSMEVITACTSKPNIRLISLGGEYDSKYGIFMGSMTLDSLRYMNFDLAILSCRTMSLQNGICEAKHEQSDLKRMAAKHSTKIVTVIDHTKFDKSSFVKTMDTENTDVLITDLPLQRHWVDFLNEKKIEYRIAAEELPEYSFLLQSEETK